MGYSDKKHTVLIIDNAQAVTRDVSCLLEDHGYEVVHKQSHQDAAQWLARGHRADVILNDFNTHCGLDGIEFLKRGLNRGIPTIAFANYEQENMDMVYLGGAIDEFEKTSVMREMNKTPDGPLLTRFLNAIENAAQKQISIA